MSHASDDEDEETTRRNQRELEMTSLVGGGEANERQMSTAAAAVATEHSLIFANSRSSSVAGLVERDYKSINSQVEPMFNSNTVELGPVLTAPRGGTAGVDNVNVQVVHPKRRKVKGNQPPAADMSMVGPGATATSAATAHAVDSVDGSSRPAPTSRAAAVVDNDDDDDADADDELVLKYGAKHVIKLFIPVTLCLIFVIISLSLITSYQSSGGASLIYTPFNENSQSSGSTKLWMSVANASIFISVVVVMTVVLILLYKYHCYKIIHGWLAFSSLMLLFFFTYMYISELFKQFNLVADMITVAVLLWNFGVVGMACIHWKGPLILQQVFLIFSCVQMALMFIKYLPEWTTWVMLVFISIWDLIAVLCPFGPLRILVETARNRNDTLFPAMVYSSTLIYSLVTTVVATASTETANNTDDDNGGFGDTNQTAPAAAAARIEGRATAALTQQQQTNSAAVVRQRHHGGPNANASNSTAAAQQQGDDDEEDNGVKLGLGDFIFYSILVGKASILGDWNTVIACFIAILIGLCFTLVLLAIYHRALPALPISLLFGLIFYFLTNLVVRPFYENLAFRQIFI